MDIDYDFWITVILGTAGGGIFGPLIVKWLKNNKWLKDDLKDSKENSS